MNKTSDGINDKQRTDCGCPKTRNPVGSANNEQLKKQKTSRSSGGGIHLLSDLSRRLARRCGAKTKTNHLGVDGRGSGASSDGSSDEKLRLLVNYLKSGSSQPVVSPVALEADEIELAERYKMHVILRDDILQDIQAGEVHQQQPICSSNQGQNRSANAEHRSDRADALKTNSISLISHSIGGTSASSPASSLSTSSVNQAHQSVHDGRSIPQIGNVTWVLRHSISDPGNNFEQHLPTFSTTSSSYSSTKNYNHLNHLHHDHHRHGQLHRSHSKHDDRNFSRREQQQEHQDKSQQQPSQEQVAHNSDNYCSCAPSSSYSSSSLSNYCLASSRSGSAATQAQQSLNPNQQSPKMFYIDDMDMIPVFPSSCLLNVASNSAATPQLAPPSMSQQQTSTPLTKANSTICCSQPSTPVIYTSNIVNNYNNNNIIKSRSSEGACGTGSSSIRSTSSGRAWTNPQNLATWIDNEVNSLVHDLETKSQQLQIKNESKHSKSGKKKWLSVILVK